MTHVGVGVGRRGRQFNGRLYAPDNRLQLLSSAHEALLRGERRVPAEAQQVLHDLIRRLHQCQ